MLDNNHVKKNIFNIRLFNIPLNIIMLGLGFVSLILIIIISPGLIRQETEKGMRLNTIGYIVFVLILTFLSWILNLSLDSIGFKKRVFIKIMLCCFCLLGILIAMLLVVLRLDWIDNYLNDHIWIAYVGISIMLCSLLLFLIISLLSSTKIKPRDRE